MSFNGGNNPVEHGCHFPFTRRACQIDVVPTQQNSRRQQPHSGDKHEIGIWAYVIMPEHVHLLIHPHGPSYEISKVLSSLKQPVSKRAIPM